MSASARRKGASVVVDAFGPAIAQLNMLRGLEKGWDGYDAQPPLGPTLDAVEALLVHLQAVAVSSDLAFPLPFASPGVNGEVQIEWDDDDGYFEVEYLNHRKCTYLLCHGDQEFEGSISADGAAGLILRYLRQR